MLRQPQADVIRLLIGVLIAAGGFWFRRMGRVWAGESGWRFLASASGFVAAQDVHIAGERLCPGHADISARDGATVGSLLGWAARVAAAMVTGHPTNNHVLRPGRNQNSGTSQWGQGLIDADLSDGVIKQRITRPGGGKSGDFRTIILFRRAERAVFVYGFGKNERDNISADELTAFRSLAAAVLSYNDKEMTTAIARGTFIEVSDGETIP